MTTETVNPTASNDLPKADLTPAIAGRTKAEPKPAKPSKAAPKKGAKAAPAPAARASLAGKILTKTAKGTGARRGATRRTESWNALRSGSTYEAAVKAGVVPADLAKMIVLGHVVATAKTPKAEKAAKVA